MKKLILLLFAGAFFFGKESTAQIQRGNVLVGGNLANLNINLGEGGYFSANITPKAAWFIRDNTAIGAYVDLDLSTAKGAGTNVIYGVGALGRYYVNDPNTNLVKHGRLFFEANAGIQGVDAGGSSTNGLGVGVGPGFAYFITENVGLEALLKYNGIVGFGDEAYTSNLGLNVGFQIYLPTARIRDRANDL